MVCNYAPAYRLLSYRVWKGLQFLQQGFHLRFWISYCAVALLAVGPACLPACLQGFCLSPGWAMCWPPVYTFEVCSCTPTETQGKAMAEKQELWQDGRLPLKCGGHVISLKGRKSMEGIFRLEKMPSPVLSLGGNFQNTSRFGQHALLSNTHAVYTSTSIQLNSLPCWRNFLQIAGVMSFSYLGIKS